MPWLLDGNNLARGRDRAQVRRAALTVARQERVRIVVFFDGAPPPGVGDAEKLGPVEIQYAPHADAAIVAFLRGAGQGWRLATDDRQLAAAVKDTGAEIVPAAGFWRKAAAVPRSPSGKEAPITDLDEEMAFLSDPRNRLPAESARVRPRKPRTRRKKE